LAAALRVVVVDPFPLSSVQASHLPTKTEYKNCRHHSYRTLIVTAAWIQIDFPIFVFTAEFEGKEINGENGIE